MKSIALMVILLGFSLVSAGQHLITDSGSALKKGMYKDFYEFKYNKPSLKFDYHFRPSKYANTYFNVSIDKESAKSIGEVYGFCDGKEVYLAFGQKLNSHTQFIRLAFIGRYCMHWYTTGEINEILAYKPSDSSFTCYSNQVINELAGCKDISKIEISSSKYSKGNYKFIGLRSTHNYGPNPDFSYKIGLWRYYDSKGNLKKEIMYDLTEHILDKASTH